MTQQEAKEAADAAKKALLASTNWFANAAVRPAREPLLEAALDRREAETLGRHLLTQIDPTMATPSADGDFVECLVRPSQEVKDDLQLHLAGKLGDGSWEHYSRKNCTGNFAGEWYVKLKVEGGGDTAVTAKVISMHPSVFITRKRYGDR